MLALLHLFESRKSNKKSSEGSLINSEFNWQDRTLSFSHRGLEFLMNRMRGVEIQSCLVAQTDEQTKIETLGSVGEISTYIVRRKVRKSLVQSVLGQ